MNIPYPTLNISPYLRNIIFPILFLSLLPTTPTYSSHAMGADISFDCLGGNQYLVRLKFYRDCAGIEVLTDQTLSFTGCGVASSLSLSLVSGPLEITGFCPAELPNSSCNGGSLPGVEEYIYEGTVTLNSPCPDLLFSWEICCRNNQITTVIDPGVQNMRIQAILNNTLSPCNNSPTFNKPPVPYLCVGQEVNYNPIVVDPDGDELVFSLVDCEEAPNNPVQYNVGYSSTAPLTASPAVSIDPASGAISFTPTIQQIGVVCVLVEEYRNGVKIGETVRDMQFVVLNCNNTPPTSSEFFENGVSTGSYTHDVCVGLDFCLEMFGADADGDVISLAPFSAIPNSNLTVSNDNSTSPSAQFCWTPTTDDVGTHFFTVTVKDQACPVYGSNTETYTINVIQNPNDDVEAGNNQTICSGESVLLNATGASNVASYAWSPTTGLSSPNSATTTATPSTTTIYTVSAMHNDGCISRDNVTVTVGETPSISVFPNSLNICPGADALLTATSQQGVSFEWFEGGNSLGTGTVSGNTSSIIVSPAATTTYTVEAIYLSNNCSSSTEITVLVGAPSEEVCTNIYVTTTGAPANDGSQSNPVDLQTALDLAACNGATIKIAEGTYNTTMPLQIPSYATLEGGFNPTTWVKSSLAGASTINRTAIGNDGSSVAPALIAVIGNSDLGFRLQDLTFTTDDGPAANTLSPAYSTYGIYLANCSNYDIVRCQILPGKGGNGRSGSTGANGATGEDGLAGFDGNSDIDDAQNHGGRGGIGAGIGGGTRGWDTANGCSQPTPFYPGCTGVSAGSATDFHSGGGGGGGGGGGNEERDGGSGGFGGGVAAGGGFGAVGDNAQPGATADCRATGDWFGNESGCNSALTNIDPESGRCGRAGSNGNNGFNGTTGSTGTLSPNGLFLPGGQGGQGTNGQGGQGGSGGGGGGGEGGSFCVDGTGASGGGGGGAGSGGEGGGSGTGGGGSFGLLLVTNGSGGNLDDCFITTAFGLGGLGGNGGIGGIGGAGGIGGEGSTEVGYGGYGGQGGAGGNGGKGGDGSNGMASSSLLLSGSALTRQETNFDLANQTVITVENVNCTNSDVLYTSPSLSGWNLGMGANPLSPLGITVNTQYSTLGRKDILYSLSTAAYTGFHNISFDANSTPEIVTDAQQIASDTFRLSLGGVASFQANFSAENYYWDFGAALSAPIPNQQYLANQTFSTPGFFEITLYVTTDCCGDSPMDRIYLYVEPNFSVSLEARIFLEGPFNSGMMNNALQINDLVPTQEPYTGLGYDRGASPFTEFLALPAAEQAELVDWLLLELRDAANPSSLITTKAVLLLRNGDLVDTNGATTISIPLINNTVEDFIIAIQHRNHVSVLSEQICSIGESTCIFDFTTNTNLAGQIHLGNGQYGLIAGSADGDNQIDASDRSESWNNRNTEGYLLQDINMDKFVDAEDRSLIWNNRNKGIVLP